MYRDAISVNRQAKSEEAERAVHYQGSVLSCVRRRVW